MENVDMQDPLHPDRLRLHPEKRFVAPQHTFDLAAEAEALAKEPEAGESGHRQKTLYKLGASTVSLFLFGHLTRLRQHHAKGFVSIHVLSGHLRVTADGVPCDLHAGQLLVMAPGVEHDVVAPEHSQMLLTVHLDDAYTPESHVKLKPSSESNEREPPAPRESPPLARPHESASGTSAPDSPRAANAPAPRPRTD